MDNQQENPSISIDDIKLGSGSQSSSDNEELKGFGKCEECLQKNTGYKWCNSCNVKRFESEWNEWTSGSKEVDKFIQEIQRKANESREFIEWIPFEKFKNIEFVAKGGFGTVFKAIWTEGYVKWWEYEKKRWKRSGEDSWDNHEVVCLKSLDNFSQEFFQEVENQLKFRKGNTIAVYGITKNPEKDDFIMVMQYAERGSLRRMLDKNYSELNWEFKLNNLRYIASGLSEIHGEGLVHKDFHSGNIMMYDKSISYITDFGLCKPFTPDLTRGNTQNKIYGVLPYVAPEVLRGREYTKESDVYSFGIIMAEVFTGLPPYYKVPHNLDLAILICEGLRPKIGCPVPQLLLDLMNRCLDAKSESRPTSDELMRTFQQHYTDVYRKNEKSEIYKQVRSIEESVTYSQSNYSADSSPLNYTTNPNAVYTSRLLNYSQRLPDPINATPAESKQLELRLPDFDDFNM